MPKKGKKKKNQKKKKKTAQQNVTEEPTMAVEEQTGAATQSSTKQDVAKLLMQRVAREQNDSSNVSNIHAFWDQQPVPKMDQEIRVEDIGPIETKTVEEITEEPYSLEKSFEWYAMDLTNDEDLDDLYNLLSKHYVEDDDNMFRFNYSREFLRWALMPPGYLRSWHLAVRVKGRGTLVGCITAIPAKIRVHESLVQMVEINFLCVHKKLRDKRLAPVLIKEITRRVNLEDTWQATYTAGVVIPKPIAKNQYFHRSFDPKKLVEIGFSSVPRNSTIARMTRLARVPPETTIEGLRPMVTEDVPEVTEILNNYLSTFKYAPVFDEEEIAHWFLPRENVVQCFVKETDGNVTDMFSYYCLSSHVINNPKHNDLNAVYSFYNVAQTEEWITLMKNALTVARIQDNKDVFNCLNVMENTSFFKQLKFGPGDGFLHYYCYNYLCPFLDASEVGLVLM